MMKMLGGQTGQMMGMDMSKMANMSEKEAEAYMMKMMGGQTGQMMGMDMSKMANMSDDEIEEYALQMAAKQSGMSIEETRRLSKMSDAEIEAWARDKMASGELKSMEARGTESQQAYDKAKAAFDKDVANARVKTLTDMKGIYERKYRPLVQKAAEDMEHCGGDAQRFDEAYRRWKTAKEDFRVECFDLWRQRIANELDGFKKIAPQGRFEDAESQIAGDALKIALDVLVLPELGTL
jgi:hypothetical protein